MQNYLQDKTSYLNTEPRQEDDQPEAHQMTFNESKNNPFVASEQLIQDEYGGGSMENDA